MGTWNEDGNEFRCRLPYVGFLVLALSLACAGNESNPLPRQRRIVADVIVSVDNHTSGPVAIYQNAGTASDSLGVVPSGSIKSFSMPWQAPTSTDLVSLEARGRRGVPRAQSESFRLTSGHRIIWILDGTHTGTVTMR
jgi:hypothetical protein